MATAHRTYQETIEYYAELRKAIYEDVESEFGPLGVTACEISRGAAVTADMWAHQPDGITIPWAWSNAYNFFRHSKPKRFDIALMVGSNLCALCYGAPSQGKIILKLHILQGRQSPNPLKGKVVEIITFAANAYAKLLGSHEVWICNPLNERLVRLYEEYGFTGVVTQGEVRHLYKEVE